MYAKALKIAWLLGVLCMSCLLAEEQHHKRVPSGFTGVRGKKSIPDSAYVDVQPENVQKADNNAVSGDDASPATSSRIMVDKRAPSGFMGMRGKKPVSSPYNAADAAASGVWEGTYPDEMYKRAPAGFMGMRGKKDMEFTNYGEQDYLKRAPSGFFGMRGKKENDEDQQEDFLNKRAPMGFFGMRGKKEDSSLSLNEDKRARSTSGFFGMRGKKHPKQSGFFGMRGKKYPYEFRGKFVGVRGKKSDPDYYYNGMDLTKIGQNLDMKELMLLLSEGDNNNINGWDDGGNSEQD